MKDFIRPEVQDAAWRARELLAGLAVTLLALWFMAIAHGVLFWSAVPALVLGLAMVGLGFQRLRFRTDGDGPGVVQVTEARIAYFGPLEGGTVSVEALAEVALDPRGRPDHWMLRERDGTTLYIPVNAAGVDVLMDAFALLPGFRAERLITARARPRKRVYIVWHREGVRVPEGDWVQSIRKDPEHSLQ